MKTISMQVFDEATDGIPAAGDAGGEMNTSETDWGKLSADFDAMEGEPVPEAPAPTTTPEPTPAPVTAPAPAPTPAPAPEPAPVAPTAPVAVAQPPAAPAAPPATPQPSLAELRTAEHARLAAGYQLTPEQVQQFALEPEKVLPVLAAQMHTNILEAAYAGINQILPQVIDSMLAARESRLQAETQFYGMFPALKEEKYQQHVHAAVRFARQMNPTGAPEQVMRAAGIQALITLGLPLPAEVLGGAPAPTPAPATPAPAAVSSIPFTPAGAGAPRGGAPAAPANPFTQLANEMLQEE